MAKQKRHLVTKKGMLELRSELDYLYSVRRSEIAEILQMASEQGSIVDNADYEVAKDEQSLVEGRILTLENIVKQAVIIDPPAACEKVGFGTKVSVRSSRGTTEQEFTIVGSLESDPSQGKISIESPIGKALLNRSAGEEVEVDTPAGSRKFLIVQISLAD